MSRNVWPRQSASGAADAAAELRFAPRFCFDKKKKIIPGLMSTTIIRLPPTFKREVYMLRSIAVILPAAIAIAALPAIASAQMQDNAMGGSSMSKSSMGGMKSKSMMMKKHKMMHHHSMHHMMKKPISSGGGM